MSHPLSSAPPIDVLVLSPHYDDAVLSCGGSLHRWSQTGTRTFVVTVCGGMPEGTTLSPYALSLHARWAGQEAPQVESHPDGGVPIERQHRGAPTQASDPELAPEAAADPDARPDRAEAYVGAARATVAQRHAEDAAALARLGTCGHALDIPDAIYRKAPRTGAWLYEGDDAIFGDLSSAERPLIAKMSRMFLSIPGLSAATRVLAPLTVGGHVDHQLVRLAAVHTWPRARIRYYEDFPYAGDDQALQSRLVGGCWSASLTPLRATDMIAKTDAVGCYASQISTFWRDESHMVHDVTAFAASRGPGSRPAERTWYRGSVRQHDRRPWNQTSGAAPTL